MARSVLHNPVLVDGDHGFCGEGATWMTSLELGNLANKKNILTTHLPCSRLNVNFQATWRFGTSRPNMVSVCEISWLGLWFWDA